MNAVPLDQAPFYFGTNFKMHQTMADTRRFVAALRAAAPKGAPVQLFLIPPFTSLCGLHDLAAPAGLWVGAQNMHWAESGAYTGEISAPMLRALEVDLVMLGHAERRHQQHERDEDLQRKVRAALDAGLRVLLCVGETALEHGCAAGPATVERQLRIDLHGVDPSEAHRLMVAYEPVWSISEGGTPATAADVQPVAHTIRTTLVDLFGRPGERVPILYGGSVNRENCAGYAALPELDGLFVGRAAWTAEGFLTVLQCALEARSRRCQR